MQIRCCVCAKVRQGNEWRKVVAPAKSETVSHGYCPECAEEAFAALRTGDPMPVISGQHV